MTLDDLKALETLKPCNFTIQGKEYSFRCHIHEDNDWSLDDNIPRYRYTLETIVDPSDEGKNEHWCTDGGFRFDEAEHMAYWIGREVNE